MGYICKYLAHRMCIAALSSVKHKAKERTRCWTFGVSAVGVTHIKKMGTIDATANTEPTNSRAAAATNAGRRTSATGSHDFQQSVSDFIVMELPSSGFIEELASVLICCAMHPIQSAHRTFGSQMNEYSIRNGHQQCQY